MKKESGKISLPEMNWKKATCEVCGESFDYNGQRRPRTCKNGECLYKFEYKIKTDQWASHQPTLFD